MDDVATSRRDRAVKTRPTALARVRAALAERDWTGVAIEVAVVVIGILIAFQIGQWGDERERRREERQFLERLHSEYGRGVEELDFVDAAHRRVIREFRQAFAARDNPAELARLSRLPDFGCGAARFRSAPFNDTAFEEMIASGRLNIVSDQRLRGEIRDLATAQAAANKQVNYGRELMLNQLGGLNPYYRFDIGPDGGSRCGMDWAGVLGDPIARNSAVRAYRVHQLSLAQRLKVRQLTLQVIHDIGCTLGKPECQG